MKKILSFIILMVCAVTGAWAGTSTVTTYQDKAKVLITVSEDPNLSTLEWVIHYQYNDAQVVLVDNLAQNGGVIQFTGDAVNASAIETIIALRTGNPKPNYGLENYFSNIAIDVSEITLNGQISNLPVAQNNAGYVVTGLIYTNNTALPDWVSGSNFKYALSNGSTNSYLYATGEQTTLPSSLTIVTDGSVTYHLTGKSAPAMKTLLMQQGVPGANIDMSGYVPEALAEWDSNGNVVITTNGAANLNGITASTTAPKNNNQTNIWGSSFEGNKTLFINGDLSQDGLNTIQSCLTTQNNGGHKLDLSGVTISGNITSLPQLTWQPQENNPHYIVSYFMSALLPAGTPINFTPADGYDYVYSPATETSNSYLYIAKAYSDLNAALSAIGMSTNSITESNKLELSGSEAQAFYNQLIAANVSADYIVYTPTSGLEDADGCYFTEDADNKVFTVYTPVAGHFKALFDRKINYAQKYDGYTFKFDISCKLNEADLLALVGNTTDKSKKYYVDLFDVPATEELCYWDDPDHQEKVGIITKVIEEIRERNSTITDQYNNYGFKGLILPKDHTIYGTGTTLIQGKNKGAAGDIATCKEFIVYHKTLKEDGVTPVDKLTVAHIYNFQSNDAVTNYQNAFNKMVELLKAHEDIISNTQIYQVSTNWQLQSSNGSYLKIDVSGLDELKKKDGDGNIIEVALVETYNNEMVGAATEAIMISHPVRGGDFATSADATGMKRTTTEKLTIVGPMSESDYAAIGTFAEGKGPRILDLRGVTTDITEALLNKIGNSEIEYLVLPETADRDLIFANYKTAGNMSGLKAVINAAPSQSSQPTIVANIYEPGSLYEARIHALDLAIGADGIYHLYSGCGVQSVTLKGSLNASDIAAEVSNRTDHLTVGEGGFIPIYMGVDGHWAEEASETPANLGLGYEQGTLTTFDLEEAVFNTKTDMNFWKAGYEKLTSVKLPTSDYMDLIPANCFNNISTLTDLCVPYNYQYIQDGAFWLTSINHMTTTDAAGAVVDNGPNTYTISANVKELGIKPETAKAFVGTIFPMNVGVEEIYCLAIKVPKCYANVFPANACYGWGGDDPDMPYCRDKYYNGGNKKQAWAVLRFPSKESYETSAGTKESSYETLKQLYTDVNKKFTKMEQTGAVDANGDPIAWPTHWEGYRVYNQASFGYTWNDWAETHDLTIDGHVNGGGSVYQGTAVGQVYVNDAVEEDGGTGTGEGDYDFNDYIGWHQIVLSQATHVNPDEIVVEEKIVRNYVYAGSFTFCIPYDLTYSQVVRMMGVPLSTDKVDNYYGANKVTGADGKVTYTGGTLIDDESKIMMPEIRQLKSVIRTKGTNGGSNSVNFRLTTNLVKELTYTDSENETHRTATAGYLNFYEDENGKWTMGTIYPGSDGEEDPICLVGGRPYIIKAYMREGETITGRNLGKYIMTRYADEFGSSASCINSSEYAEQLETFKKVQDSGEVKVDETDLETMRFAKPYENHKVQAIDGGENSVGALNYTENDKTTRYYYTMVGQFWEQDLPLYCVYMGQNGSWYRYTKDNGKNYKWNAYKCVIMATPEVTAVGDIEEEDIKDAMGITAAQDVPANAIPMPFKALPTKDWTFNHFGGGFRNISHCYFPMNYVNTEDWIPGPMSLWFIGRDDYTFKNQTGANSRYIFSIDDDEEIVDLGENVTEVKAIDMLDGVPQIYGDMKVYNLSGQYVGNSTEGLSKGIYIVGGRKVVVE